MGPGTPPHPVNPRPAQSQDEGVSSGRLLASIRRWGGQRDGERLYRHTRDKTVNFSETAKEHHSLTKTARDFIMDTVLDPAHPLLIRMVRADSIPWMAN